MPALDLRTVVFLSGAICVLMSLVLFFMHRSHRDSILGLKEWAAAPLVLFVSTLLLGTQGVVSPWLSVVVANGVLISGLALFFMGTCRFYGLPAARWPWLALGLAVPLLIWWGVANPHYGWRLVVVHVVSASLQAHTFWVIWRHDHASLSARFTLAVLGSMAVLSVARIVSTPLIPEQAHLFTSTPLQNLFVGTYGFSILALTVGFVLLASERLREQLQHLLSHDSLTGTLSRRALFDRAMQELQRTRRSQRPLSMLVMDLDHFKQINDQHGHQMGDRVLRDFAERTLKELRQVDLLGRFGGEEFMAVLPETDLDGARLVADRILRNRSADPSLAPLTVSIGVASRPPLAPEEMPEASLEALISQADQALYQAKSAGRDRLVVASPTR